MVNKPARAVGPVTVHKIIETAMIGGSDLAEAGRKTELSPKARAGVEAFYKVIEAGTALLDSSSSSSFSSSSASPRLRANSSSKKKKKDGLVSGEGLSRCVTLLVNDSGIADYHAAQDEAGTNRIGNLQELVNASSEYPQSREGLLEFLEDIELDRSMKDNKNNQDETQDAVTLITFHNTKGLEFKRVIMTGLEQGVFPREDKKGDELEEERRLFYVGATRAMDELYLTNCAERRMYGRTMPTKPSLFLREIDRNYVKIDDRLAGRTMTTRPSPEWSGRAFNPYNLSSAGTVNNNSEVEERAGWKRGQRLFHEDHGYGAVMEVKDSEDGPIVRVRFESGEEKRFLSEHQGRAYEKIEGDY
jgi:DNA helicase-2/ATP-dependent DNA helicase PcrA